MNLLKQILPKLKIQTLRYVTIPIFFIFILLSYPHSAFAIMYQPGQTLNPSCLPTSTNCGVVPPLAISQATSTVTASAAAFVATSTSPSTFPYASTTAISVSGGTASTSALTLGTLTGIMRSVDGVVKTALVRLTTDITGILSVIHGGTGMATAPTYGKVLLGNSSGTYDLVATSSLGISSQAQASATPGGASNQIQVNSNGTFGASPSLTFNSNTLSVQGTASSTNLAVANNANVSGALTAASAAVSATTTTQGLTATFAHLITSTITNLTSSIAKLASATITNLTGTNATLYTANVGALTATSSLAVNGNTTLANTTITNNNTLTVGTGLTSLGGSATIAGTLNVTGTTTLNNLTMNSTRITDLAAPIGINDAANKAYVDAIAQGISWQQPVVALSTTTAPTTPTTGDRYVMLSGATSFGSCTLNQIAQWSGSAWTCSTPSTGWSVYVNQVATNYNFNGTKWVSLGSTINHNNLFGLQGGQTGQYYHINKANYDEITNAKAQLASLLSTGAPSFAGLNITGSSTRADSLNVVGTTTITGDVSVSATTTTKGISATFAHLITSTITNLTSSIAKLASATITNLIGTNATLYTASVGALTATSSLAVNGHTTLTNASTTQLSVSGPAYFNGQTTLNGVTAKGSIIPSVNSVYSLGDATHQWKSLYISSTTIYVAGIPLSNNAGALTWGGSSLNVGGFSVSGNSATSTGNLSAASLSITGNSALATILFVNGTGTKLSLSSSLAVAGQATLANASSTNQTVSGYLNVAGKTTLTNASTTNQSLSGYLNVSGQTALVNASTTALTVSGNQWITPLATPAGTFLAVNAKGQVIATSTPASGIGTGTKGQLAFYNANGNNLTATSSIFIGQSGTFTASAIAAINSLSVDKKTTSTIVYKATGKFNPKVDYTTGYGPSFVAIADLNGDGKPDLAVTNELSNTVSVFINNGNGTFAPKVDYTTGSSPMSVAIADLNGDGKPDLAVANFGTTTVSILLNNGNGTFAPKVDYTTGSFPMSVAIADLNGDGRPDLAVANYGSNTVSVLLNNGNGTFASKVDYTTGATPYSVAIGDLNGNGKPDLAVANYGANTISILLNNGNGTFAPKVDYTTGTSPWSVAIADLNGDGKPDLAVANYGSSTVSVFINSGNGTFAPKVDYTTGSSPMSVAIADLNGDGKPDLAVANSRSNTASILLNNGNGTFASKVDYTTGTIPDYVAIGDLNGDSTPDLVLVNNGSITISVLTNITTSSISTITSDAFMVNGTTGKVGIGTTTPNAKLGIQGGIGVNPSQLYLASNGNVGVGTATTSAKLTVQGAIALALNTTPQTTTNSLYNKSGTLYWNGSAVGAGVSGTEGQTILMNNSGSQVATSTLFISPSGNVGIGTTTPADKLDVAGNINISNGSTLKVNGADYSINNLADAQNDTVNNNLFLGGAGFSGTFYNNYNTAIGRYAFDNPNTDNTQALYGNKNTAVGYNTLTSNTTGSFNSAQGANTLYSNTTGSSNSAQGMNALYSNTTGSNNSAQGMSTLYSNSTGSFNSAQGASALYSNTFGNYNSAQGMNALLSNTTGSSNSAQGASALYSNTTGSNNAAQGASALYSNTTGSNNSAQGINTLFFNTTGYSNSAQGINSLYSNTTGSNNSAQGVGALYSNTSGNYNSAQGMSALYSNTTGSVNSAQGMNALFLNTIGFRNSAQGADALHSNTSGSYNSAQGSYALYSNTTGNNNSAQGANALSSNTTGSKNTAQGLNALQSNTTGSYNSAQGANSLSYNSTGSHNTAVGDYAGVDIINYGSSLVNTNPSGSTYLGFATQALKDGDTNETVIGYRANGIGSNSVVLGNDSVITTALKGNVGIGTTNPSFKLDVNGDINVAKGNAYKYNGSNVIIASTTLSNYFFGSAGNSTMTGSSNTASGINALSTNTTGSNNTADGTYALSSNSTGNQNTAYGQAALYYNTTGYQNVAMGNAAGTYIADGTTANAISTNSTYLGVQTKALASGDVNETVIGYNAIGIGSNSVMLGNSSVITTALNGKVGIGTTSPIRKLVVAGGDVKIVASGSVGAAIQLRKTGTLNGWSEWQQTGTATRLNNGNLGGNVFNILNTSGNVGIGNSSPAQKLVVDGGIQAKAGLPGGSNVNGTGYSFSSPGDTDGGMFSNADGTLKFLTNSVTAMTIDSSQNVGIGIASPKSKLEVVGSSCFSVGSGATTACGTAAGNIYYTAANSGNYDVAEKYRTYDKSLSAGDVITLDPAHALSVVIATSSDVSFIGVVSTAPGVLLGGADGKAASTTVPVALSGRVPVKISLANGPIAIGDRLTVSSTTPGVAVKFFGNGSYFGQALQPYTHATASSTIEAFINPGTYFYANKSVGVPMTVGVPSLAADALGGTSSSTLISSIVSSIKNITIQIAGFAQSITTKVLTATTGRFTNLSTKNISTQELCVGDTCINQVQLKALLKKAGQTADVSVPAQTSTGNSGSSNKSKNATGNKKGGDTTGNNTTGTATSALSSTASSTTPAVSSTTPKSGKRQVVATTPATGTSSIKKNKKDTTTVASSATHISKKQKDSHTTSGNSKTLTKGKSGTTAKSGDSLSSDISGATNTSSKTKLVKNKVVSGNTSSGITSGTGEGTKKNSAQTNKKQKTGASDIINTSGASTSLTQ